jgi:ribonuclease HII
VSELGLVAGVDDAGRGSVLGPLVIAGVSFEESRIPKLVDLGVKDSKLLSPKKRSELYWEVKKLATFVANEKIQPEAIDKVVFNGEKLYRLNYLEARHMARVLNKLEFDVAYVDCCDTNQKRFGNLIADMMVKERKNNGKRNDRVAPFSLGDVNPLKDKIKSEHHADRNYPVVSAASILAKVTRDAAIERLHKKHGAFGSGYPSDPETLMFLKGFVDKSESLPAFTRNSWATISRLYGKRKDSRDLPIESF